MQVSPPEQIGLERSSGVVRLPLAGICRAVSLDRAGPLGPVSARSLGGPTWRSARGPEVRPTKTK